MNYQDKTMAGLLAGILALVPLRHTITEHPESKVFPIAICSLPQSCVFRTIMGEEEPVLFGELPGSERITTATRMAFEWLAQAQLPNGGFGAGSHARQDIMDPLAVPADPATTATVAMAFLRYGSSELEGSARASLHRATDYLLNQIENADPASNTITTLTGTQIQSKLGANIDVVMAAQFLSNLLTYLQTEPVRKERVMRDLNICVEKIQRAQAGDGSIVGSGWAGVLQSSFATNALETAAANGAQVDKEVLTRAKDFQKNNYDPATGNVNTDLGAGVMLYSVAGSTRASAKEARAAREAIAKAKENGTLPKSAPVSAENLQRIGYSQTDALNYSTAYGVYESAKRRAQDEDVITGFGSNGGEEFLSYLQTGESMIIGKDGDWKPWYENMSARILQIQNQDGSWNGHHCITSPVFCTATCLLILAVNNDVERLIQLGQD